MSRILASALFVVLVLVAGCTDPASKTGIGGDGGLEGSWLADALALEHDHADPAVHTNGTPNIHPLAYLKWQALLLDKYPAQQYGEIDVVGDLAFVAALASGFAIVDIKEPASPRTLSFATVPPGYVADIKAAEGGNLVLLGMQGSVLTGLRALGVPVPPIPVAFPVSPYPATKGILAYDATDKANPKPAGYVFVDRGCHMLSVMKYGTQTYVYCAPNDDTVQIFRVAHVGPAVAFEPVATWSPDDLVGQVNYKLKPTSGEFTHDMTVQKDPITGEPVMLVSHWNLGVYVVDVRDPAKPTTLGRWAGEGATRFKGALHTSLMTAINGSRILVTIPEYANPPTLFVLNADDPARPTFVSEWAVEPKQEFSYEQAVLFSMHNFQLVDDKAYLAMYHGGVWVLNLTDPAHPRPVGYTLPRGERPAGGAIIGSLVPLTWDVAVANGYVYAVDIPTGLHVFKVDGDPLGNAKYDSFA